MEELMLTSGASAGLFLAVSLLADKNCIVYIESPTYFIILRILKDLGIGSDRLVPIPMTPDGMDVDYLEDQLAKQPHTCLDPERYLAFVYSVSTYHNPTGVSLEAANAKKLIRLARKFDFLVICDDVYNLLCYNGVSVYL